MSSVFYVGQRFDSFNELSQAIKQYQKENLCVLVTRDSRSIEAAQKRLANKTLNPALKYNDVKYTCQHGGDYRERQRKGLRQTSTSKIGCPFSLQFRTTEDGQQLELKGWLNSHNHDITDDGNTRKSKRRKLDGECTQASEDIEYVDSNRPLAVSKESTKAAAREFLNFVNKAPSPFHAVATATEKLKSAGFCEIKEAEHWDVKPMQKCFLTRNKSTLIAFAVGGKYSAGNGFSIIGAHTDSPCLKVKPISKKVKQGFIQVGVECYGGGTWHTWTDRDLKVAGKVMVRSGKQIEQRLVDVNRPIMRVPNLAIHLNRDYGSKFEFNKETNLTPVIATVVQEELNETKQVASEEAQASKHHPVLISVLSEELGVAPDDILDFELCLADHTPAVLGGAFEEFIFAPRLDNLHSSYCALQGLVGSSKNESLKSEDKIRMIALFDNEEVGSQSAQGAGSTLLELVLRRLSAGGRATAFEESIPKSMMVSADMAHAVHPNFSEKHEDQHRPDLHKGVVIKFNANQRYATTTITTTILREVARIANVPLQDFVVRNDSPCGSTIGPIMSAKLGMPTVDLGSPQLSMHSIREMCGTTSVKQSEDLFQAFFENYSEVYNSIQM